MVAKEISPAGKKRGAMFRVAAGALQAIVDRVPAVVHVKDSAGRYVLVNSCCEQILKREAGTMVGRTDSELWPEAIAAIRRANDRSVLSDGAVIECEEISPGEDGLRTYLALKFPLDGGSERFVCSVAMDITERTRTDALKDDAIAAAGHELRTPLTVIQSVLLYLTTTPSPDAAAGGRALMELAKRNCRHMLAVIDSYLDLAAIEKGGAPLKLDDIDLRDVSSDAVESIRHLDAERGLRFRFRIGPEPALVRGDAARVREVLDNLLSNAVKYSPDGSEIEIVVAARGDRRSVSVRDHGSGISKEFAPLVFRAFARDAAAARNVKGTGLGLSIAKSLVERMDGSLWHESAEGGGTIFTFDLPAVRKPIDP